MSTYARFAALGIARATNAPTARLWRRRHRRAPSLGRYLIPPLCGAVRIPDPWRPREPAR